jgi:putative membrane protein
MSQEKRYHPLLILHDIWRLVKNSIFLFIFLFIFQANSEFWLYKYGRITLVLLVVVIILDIPIRWLISSYKIGDRSLQLQQRRLFTTSSRTIPYENIQHVQRKITLFHRIFNMTSLTLETNMTGDHSSITFHVLTPEEALEIERQIRRKGNVDAEVSYEENQSRSLVETEEVKETSYIIHFTPTRHDIFKATLTSFSFIAVIPIFWSLISNAEQIFQLEGQIEGILTNFLNSWSWWVTLISLIVLTLTAVAAGGILTVLRYGEYEIGSDSENIYIIKGMLEKTSFTITKTNVQAVSVHQSFMKRILGLAEVKLICSGGAGSEDLEVNSLYPFLPVQRAYAMIHEILPDYQVTPAMERLPKKALLLWILRPSWFWMMATGLLFYVKPDFFGIDLSWWMLSAVILVLVIVSRLLNFFQSRYTINDQSVQFKTGGFNTRLFISKRNKIVELQFTSNIFQKKLGLASVAMSNRARPVKRTKMNNIPIEWCKNFHRWYMSGMRTS